MGINMQEIKIIGSHMETKKLKSLAHVCATKNQQVILPNIK